MSDVLREWMRPQSVRRLTAPPLEAGLRPNDRLDTATVMHSFAPFEIDALVVRQHDVVVARDRRIISIDRSTGSASTVAEMDGVVTAVAAASDGLAVAVTGQGIVRVDGSGRRTIVSDDSRVGSCVTDLVALADGSVLACRGSMVTDSWAAALVSAEATGLLVRLADGGVAELASHLAWPSGVAAVESDADEVLISLSHAHRVERRSLTSGRTEPVLWNLAGYPGRISRGRAGFWLAVPYLRNRATELMLEDRALVDDMVASIPEDAWLVPRLAVVDDLVAPFQVGQLRVLGEVKPWSPPRSYGLVMAFDELGNVEQSAHSRAGGHMHGATAVAETSTGELVVVCRGAGTILHVDAGER